MKTEKCKILLRLLTVAMLCLATTGLIAQEKPTKKEKLKTPAELVGSWTIEGHDGEPYYGVGLGGKVVFTESNCYFRGIPFGYPTVNATKAPYYLELGNEYEDDFVGGKDLLMYQVAGDKLTLNVGTTGPVPPKLVEKPDDIICSACCPD